MGHMLFLSFALRYGSKTGIADINMSLQIASLRSLRRLALMPPKFNTWYISYHTSWQRSHIHARPY